MATHGVVVPTARRGVRAVLLLHAALDVPLIGTCRSSSYMIIPRPILFVFSLCFLVQSSAGQHGLSAPFHGELPAGTHGSDRFAARFSGALVLGLRLWGGGKGEWLEMA